MTVDNINVEETVKRVTELVAAERDLFPAFKTSLEVLLLLISILVNRLARISHLQRAKKATNVV
jgi:transposase